MSKCNCCPTCAPPCNNLPATYGPDSTYSGDKVRVTDDNGGERALEGEGTLVRRDGSVSHTKGNPKDGEIQLDLDKVGGFDELIGVASGIMKALIADGNEGKILIVQGNKFTLVNPTVGSTTFNPSDVGEYLDSIAAFGCGPNGTIRLGKLRAGVDAFIYYDSTGKLTLLSAEDTVAKIISLLCPKIELLGPAESILHHIGCTSTGAVRKFLPYAQGTFHVRPRVIIKAQAAPDGSAFIPIDQNFDVRTVTGYESKYTSAIIGIDLTAYSGTRSYDLYVLVDGIEYGRVRAGAGGSDSVTNQIIVPIPAGKIINFKVLEYTNSPGTYGPTGVTLAFDAFMM